MYDQYVYPFSQIASLPPSVDIALHLESPNRVRVDVSNTSPQQMTGTLHVALVERHRVYAWMDMNVVDFVCRAMLPGPGGQAMKLDPGAKASSAQQFSVQNDWNYCSIVAFFQASDKRIVQGAMMPLDSTIPVIQITEGPKSGVMWLKNTGHTVAWSSDRPLGAVEIEYSDNGGERWQPIQTSSSGTGQCAWTTPQISSSRCLLAVRDPYGGSRAVSGLFAIGIKGDLNADGVVNEADRSLLIAHLLENNAASLPGADMNEDGVIDILDLIYLETLLKKVGGPDSADVR